MSSRSMRVLLFATVAILGGATAVSACATLKQADGNLCCAPQEEPGQCVPLKQCKKLQRLVSRGYKRTAEEQKLLRDSICGGTQSNPKVCCPVVPMEHCGPGDPFKIAGGRSALPMMFPWMANIGTYKSSGNDFFCGGTLINDRYVLTAAHCVTPRRPNIVRLGEFDLSNGKENEDCYRDETQKNREICAPPVMDIEIAQIIAHPEYSPKNASYNYLQHDIALIRLARSVTFNQAISPICLPFGSAGNEVLNNIRFRIAGWGKTTNSRGTATLQHLSVPNVDLRKCRDLFSPHPQVFDSQICAGAIEGQSSCSGDSGGPLMHAARISNNPSRNRNVQYGIVSFGENDCGNTLIPTVYTRVAHYLPWIVRNLRPPEGDFKYEALSL